MTTKLTLIFLAGILIYPIYVFLGVSWMMFRDGREDRKREKSNKCCTEEE